MMNRRTFLRASAAATGVTTLSGCLSGLFDTRPALAPPLVENRPDAVYYPTHIEGMDMVEMTNAKWYTCALTYSYSHRFWIVTGQNRKKVTIQPEDSVHLMPSIWDRETKLVPPNANLSVDITQNGESVVKKSLWPMLSQNMGYHFGDNVALPGDGTYTVTVRIGPMQTRRTGRLQNQFGEPASVTFTFDYSKQQRNEIMYKDIPTSKQGQKGAVDPTHMKKIPLAQVPPKAEFPGRIIGEASSGDGVFVVTVLDEPPAGIDATGPYLAVSARTPYNRYPLPFMSLKATLTHGQSTVFDGWLTPTLDHALHYHYGATVKRIRPGDTLRLTVGTPPQVARHEGYETAFFKMPPMKLTISS
jgi:hypothetical protein